MSSSTRPVLPVIATLVLLVAVTGCAGSNDGAVLDPVAEGLAGTWNYQVVNAYDSTFIGCTGDASVLEGKTLVQGMQLASICIAANSFDVTQSGSTLTFQQQGVSCGLGSGSVGGLATVVGSGVVGEWQSASDGGVNAVQPFSGSMLAGAIEITETARTFTGSFQGSCQMSPPLNAMVTIQ